MQLNLIYSKTAKGLEEVQTRTHKLPAHLRRLLIMVDGHSTAADLIGRLSKWGDVALALEQLATGGFIAILGFEPSADPAASSLGLLEFNLEQAKGLIHSVLLSAMGPAAEHRIECVEAVTEPEQLRLEIEILHDILLKMLPKTQAEQTWRQLEPIVLALDRWASFQPQDPVTRPTLPPKSSGEPTIHEDPSLAPQAFNLDKAKGFIRFTLLGAMGPTAARRIERVEAATTPEQLRLELDAIRDMLPKVLSKRQADQTWRQLEPLMLSLYTPSS